MTYFLMVWYYSVYSVSFYEPSPPILCLLSPVLISLISVIYMFSDNSRYQVTNTNVICDSRQRLGKRQLHVDGIHNVL